MSLCFFHVDMLRTEDKSSGFCAQNEFVNRKPTWFLNHNRNNLKKCATNQWSWVQTNISTFFFSWLLVKIRTIQTKQTGLIHSLNKNGTKRKHATKESKSAKPMAMMNWWVQTKAMKPHYSVKKVKWKIKMQFSWATEIWIKRKIWNQKQQQKKGY